MEHCPDGVRRRAGTQKPILSSKPRGVAWSGAAFAIVAFVAFAPIACGGSDDGKTGSPSTSSSTSSTSTSQTCRTPYLCIGSACRCSDGPSKDKSCCDPEKGGCSTENACDNVCKYCQ